MADPTHKSLLASLSPEQRQYFTRRSNVAGLAGLSLHCGLIVLLGMLLVLRVPGWPLLLLPQGVLIVFLFTLLHEVTHRTVFESKSANDVVAIICGWVLMLPPGWFRYFHFAHHRYTQNPDKDPELQSPKPSTTAGYLFHISGLPVAWGNFKTLIANATVGEIATYVPQASLGQIRRESRWMLAGYVVTAIGSVMFGFAGVVVWCWLVPMIVGQPFLRLYLMAEHGGCAFVDDMFANTRTTFTTAVIRRLAWNMPYHAEHHAYPNVPFYRLPEFHQLVREKLQVTSEGYVAFHRDTLHRLKTDV